MSSATLPLKMPKRVIRKVRSLRWLVRLYVGVEGLASVALVLGIAFWAGLWIDWAFEPSPQLRILLWAAVLLATCYVAVRYLFSRAIARLPNTSLALLLERNYPELKESLVTTVEAAERRRVAPLGDKSLLEQTSQTASAAMGRIQLRPHFSISSIDLEVMRSNRSHRLRRSVCFLADRDFWILAPTPAAQFGALATLGAVVGGGF